LGLFWGPPQSKLKASWGCFEVHLKASSRHLEVVLRSTSKQPQDALSLFWEQPHKKLNIFNIFPFTTIFLYTLWNWTISDKQYMFSFFGNCPWINLSLHGEKISKIKCKEKNKDVPWISVKQSNDYVVHLLPVVICSILKTVVSPDEPSSFFFTKVRWIKIQKY
jgi:hypothetical protein